MADLHWAAALIGRPYRERGHGPDAFDCWGLLQFAWRMRLGIDVPDVRLRSAQLFRDVIRAGNCHANGLEAIEIAAPQELDAVYMTSRRLPHHVGLWVAPGAVDGGVLHAIEDAGVVFQRRADLAVHGFTIVKFMRLVLP